MRPPAEPTCTTLPFEVRSIGRKAWVTATGATELTSSWRRSSSTGRNSRGPATAMPALFTTPARRPPPSVRATSSTADAICSASVTSSMTEVTEPLERVRSRSASSGFRTPANTANPRLARWRTQARPIPEDAPVTTTPPLPPGASTDPPLDRRIIVYGVFAKILIANRGEIAVRVARTCAELGVATVGVYSDVDARARHVAAAGEAVHLPGVAPAETYLNVAAIIEAARSREAEAIHPGYGFLSERADAAETVTAAGHKVRARRLARSAGVSVVPGTVDPVSGIEEVQAFGESHGYPIAIKAAG